MHPTRQPGISYTRFSDPKQRKGDSEDRQDRMFRDFCQAHNLTPVKEVFADRGLSGYKDEHRKRGRLGQLVEMAKDGRFEPGTVVVIEAWDRLGRLRPDRQVELISELLRTGIRVGVCRLNDVFADEDFGTHKWTTLAVFIQLAYQESRQKAERVAESWKKRREMARRGQGDARLLAGRLPAWLEKVDGQARVIPERAAVVKRIFRLAAEGYGHTRIVSTLDREKVAPFGVASISEGRHRPQFSGRWTRPYVALILRDRRAVGEVQPRKIDGTPDGPPIAGILPAVVTEDEFQLARAGQGSRNNRAGRPVAERQGARHVNAFRGLLRHARDGQGFVLTNKGTRERPELILLNAKGSEGRGKCYTFPYAVFEAAILALLREVSPDDVMPRAAEVASRLDVLRARLANVRDDIARIQDDLGGGYSKGLVTVLRGKEAEEESLAAELQDELARTARPAEKAWADLPGLLDVLRSAADPNDIRLKLRPVLRRVIEDIRVLIVPRASRRLVAVQVWFMGGEARRDYLIEHQTAGFRRQGGWRAWSLSDGPKLPALDLRAPKHVERLARLLEAVDLEKLRGS